MPDTPVAPPRADGSAPSRVDGSMSLLVDMTAAALDPAYADVAARRASAGARRPPRSRVLAGLVLLLVGVITGVAAAQVRENADRQDTQRVGLLADVRELTAETDALDEQAARLRREVSEVRGQALNQDARGRAAAARLAELELATGLLTVKGPGLVVTLDDAEDAGGGSTDRGGQLGDGRIYDRDLQDVVNALWEAGAEAMSVNGTRLTAQTAIRSAGEAVLVDFRPLSPPYVLRAVGDVDAMEPAFVDGATARRFQTWTSLYGLRFAITRSDDLTLPAAPQPDLRLARPGGAP